MDFVGTDLVYQREAENPGWRFVHRTAQNHVLFSQERGKQSWLRIVDLMSGAVIEERPARDRFVPDTSEDGGKD